MSAEAIERMLTGGHHNSLGRTEEVVALIMQDIEPIEALFRCYRSKDAVVRMRVSNAIKKIGQREERRLIPHIDRLLDDVGSLDQASAQWTLAQLFAMLVDHMNLGQKERATCLMQRNLAGHDDWIVLNTTIETLSEWAREDPPLKQWLRPHLERLTGDARKSVANRAARKHTILYGD